MLRGGTCKALLGGFRCFALCHDSLHLRGLGHTTIPLVTPIALVANAILNYLLIYGVGGLPELGGEGCGCNRPNDGFELALVLPFVEAMASTHSPQGGI